MLENLARKVGGQRRAQSLGGVAIGAAGLLIIVLPTALRLRRSLAALATVQSAYASKLSWAGKKGEMEKRVEQHQETVEALDATLITSEKVSTLTRVIASAARAAGCSVAAIRPLAPNTLSRGDEEKGKAAQTTAANEPVFVEFPIRLEVEGEYRQVQALLKRLAALPTHLRLKKALVQPSEGDRQMLICELELAAYALAEDGQSKAARPGKPTTPGGRS